MTGQKRLQTVGDASRIQAVSARLAFPGQPVKMRQRGGATAQGAGDVKQVAGTGGGAEQRPSGWNRPDEDDVGEWNGRFGKVTARERSFVSRSQGQQGVAEARHPGG